MPMPRKEWVVLLVALAACRSPVPASVAVDDAATTTPPSTASTTASTTASATASASAPASPSAPPPVAVTCTRNEDCAVAVIDVSGPTACCSGCGSTPGTRAWYAQLQLWCGAHPPTNCPPLACPIASTRAVCDRGTCARTALAPDGGPDFVTTEEKCLPVQACGAWAGCARVRGDFQNGWYLADPLGSSFGALPVGSEVTLEKDLCTPHAPGKCSGARLVPRGITCPPQSVPPLASPPKPCVLTGTSCHP